jgi:DNA-binding transcriptional ArsR family regulator
VISTDSNQSVGKPSDGVACGRLIDYRRLSMEVRRPQAELWATWFAALGDATRIMILNCLATSDKPLSVGEIVEQVDVGQSTVSHHLAILADTCFVLVEPVGTSRLYRINERCLECFPATAEVVMGRAPERAPWGDDQAARRSRRHRRAAGVSRSTHERRN